MCSDCTPRNYLQEAKEIIDGTSRLLPEREHLIALENVAIRVIGMALGLPRQWIESTMTKSEATTEKVQ